LFYPGWHPITGYTNFHGNMGHFDRTILNAGSNNRPLDATERWFDSRSIKPAVVSLHWYRSWHHRVLRFLQGRQNSKRARTCIFDFGHLGMVPDAIHGCADRYQVEEVPIIFRCCPEESPNGNQLLQHRCMGNRSKHDSSSMFTNNIKCISKISKIFVFFIF